MIITPRNQQTERAKYVSEFGCVDEALAFSVVRLERFHEVRKRASVCLVAYCFVDGQNLLEPVLLFTCMASPLVNVITAGCFTAVEMSFEKARFFKSPNFMFFLYVFFSEKPENLKIRF